MQVNSKPIATNLDEGHTSFPGVVQHTALKGGSQVVRRARDPSWQRELADFAVEFHDSSV